MTTKKINEIFDNNYVVFEAISKEILKKLRKWTEDELIKFLNNKEHDASNPIVEIVVYEKSKEKDNLYAITKEETEEEMNRIMNLMSDFQSQITEMQEEMKKLNIE